MEPKPIKLTGAALEMLKNHLHDRIDAIKDGLQTFHETKLPEWRRAYEGRPLERVRNFPFRNASNLVVPLIGIHADTLQARVMAAIWRTLPVFPVKLYGTYEDALAAENNRKAWEDWMQFNAMEPEQLDLYRTEEDWIGEICRYGTSVVKICNEKRFMDSWTVTGDGTSDGGVSRETTYDGPAPQKLALEDFGIQPSLTKWENADLMYHRVRLQKYQLMDRRYRGVYAPDQVDKILGNPDRTSVDYVTQQREEDSEIRTSARGYAEWDIYECWLNWRAPNQSMAPKIICWYHPLSNTLLRAIYDFYPDRPFVLGRLLYRDDSVFGYGLCETLGLLQEEISMIHNGRRDMMTVVNTKVWRVDPTSKLHEGYEIYPSAMLPAVAGEIEPLAQGEPMTTLPIDEEKLTLDLAERRSGVSPPMQGFGAAQGTKGGGESAAGTLSMLQEGNNRTNLTISDVRYAHLKIGRIVARQYAFLGLEQRTLDMFGTQSRFIEDAARLVKDGKMGLAVSTSTASVNKEVEKQNDLMLSGVMNQHYQMIGQLIQGITSSVTPPALKDYLMKVVDASDKMMKGILRTFDRDDADVLVPKPNVSVQNGGQPNGGGNGQAPGQPAIPQSLGMAQSGGGGRLLPFPGGLGNGNEPGVAPG